MESSGFVQTSGVHITCVLRVAKEIHFIVHSLVMKMQGFQRCTNQIDIHDFYIYKKFTHIVLFVFIF